MGAKRPEPIAFDTDDWSFVEEIIRKRDDLRRQLAASRKRERKLREGLIGIGLAAAEQQRKGEPMIHDAIIDVVKFSLRECEEGEGDG